MYFVTADEHYGHENSIIYSKRPYTSLKEMEEDLIARHNEVVEKDDIVIHAGDFCLKGSKYAWKIIERLNGTHIFLKGSHDYWLPKKHPTRWEGIIEGQYVVIDHYPLRTWARSHYGSWQLHGHNHGRLPPIGKQLDVGVDTGNYYPYSWGNIVCIMNDEREDNPNLVTEEERQIRKEKACKWRDRIYV